MNKPKQFGLFNVIRGIDADKAEIAALKTKNEELETKFSILEKEMTSLLNRITALEG